MPPLAVNPFCDPSLVTQEKEEWGTTDYHATSLLQASRVVLFIPPLTRIKATGGPVMSTPDLPPPVISLCRPSAPPGPM